jgi:hypothetical protein
MVFIACDIPKFLGNIKQLLEAETILINIIHLKVFLVKVDNVLLLKYIYIYIYL